MSAAVAEKTKRLHCDYVEYCQREVTHEWWATWDRAWHPCCATHAGMAVEIYDAKIRLLEDTP